MFSVHPFHQVSLAAGLSYALALIFFFHRAKAAVKQEALSSRKRVEYSLIFFLTSACTLAYLAKEMTASSAEEAGFLSAIVGEILPSALVPSSDTMRTALKMCATYGVFTLAFWARSRSQRDF